MEREHEAHEEEEWASSKLYQCKQSFKETFISQIKLSKDHSLMDVGCSEGEFLHEMAATVRSVVGVDIDATAIEKARKANTAPNVSYEVADFGVSLGVHEDEWREGFHVIISGFTMHFIHDVKTFIKNVHHCMKPGGRLYLTYMGDRRGWAGKAQTFVRRHPKWAEVVKDANPKNNIVESTTDEVAALFRAQGFTHVQLEEHDLATDNYSDPDAQAYIYGVLTLSHSISETDRTEYMAEVCKFTRDHFQTNTPWEYVQLTALKPR